MTVSASTSAFSPVLVAPTFNNAHTLLGVLEKAERLGHPVIVVDDGSSDHTARLLREWLAAPRSVEVMVISHHRNRGKADALRSGFAAAIADGHSHVVTFDTDGQHDPEDIVALLHAAQSSPNSLVIGHRDDQAPEYPQRSRIGRRLSNLAIRLETGRRVEDCQCGLRVYPLRLVALARCVTGRYAFEAEIITRAAWAGFDILSVPVTCRYLQGKERVSHFRPWLDSLHGVWLHAILLIRSLIPMPHRKVIDRTAPLPWPWERRFWNGAVSWISPMRLWREMRHDEAARSNQALGVGIGVFIANLPIYGLQTITALYVARRLHLHPLPVVAGSQLSSPPLNIVLVGAAIVLGHAILHGTIPSLNYYDLAHSGFLEIAGEVLLEWLVGGVAFGLVLGGAATLCSLFAFSMIPVEPRPDGPPTGLSGSDAPAEPLSDTAPNR